MSKALLLVPISLSLLADTVSAQAPTKDRLLFGVAYYDEYMPHQRLEQDVRMMKDVGISA
jgi:beta-galactosidase